MNEVQIAFQHQTKNKVQIANVSLCSNQIEEQIQEGKNPKLRISSFVCV